MNSRSNGTSSPQNNVMEGKIMSLQHTRCVYNLQKKLKIESEKLSN